MASSIMANTTQDQEKNSTANDSGSETYFSDTEEITPREEIDGEGEEEECEGEEGEEGDVEEEEEEAVEEEEGVEDEEGVEEEGEGEEENEGGGEREQERGEEVEVEVEVDGEGVEKVPEDKPENQLDHDQDRRNPQYIPKGGAFYEHDNRTSLEDVENKDPQEGEKKKKVWKESKASERWLHDWYKESEQQPKTTEEIIEIYGYDIRNEEAPPRARRRRKYGRGPDKYKRNWEDEQAYMPKPNSPGRRLRRRVFGREEFPPLPNRKHNGNSNVEKTAPKSSSWKRNDEDTPSNNRTTKTTTNKINNNYDKPRGSSHTNRNEGHQKNNNNNSNNYNNNNNTSSGWQGGNRKKINDEDVRTPRDDKTKWKNSGGGGGSGVVRRGKHDSEFERKVPKSNQTKSSRQDESQSSKNVESSKNSSGDSDVGHVTEGFSQMTFHSKRTTVRETRPESNEIAEQEMDNPANRLNPKRYSKNRKGFTNFFRPEDIVEMDPVELKQLHQEQQQKTQQQHVNLQQQPLNIQNVIGRYPGTYNGTPGYMAPRPIITGIPQQGMSPQGLQQALSPQGIPQQALSPQVPGLGTIELQQGPLPPQPNFVPPMYIDMDPHYAPSEMIAPFTGYAAYSSNQPNKMYQPSGGITYYNTECQNSNQIRPPPARRQKAAIPILPPPE